MDVARLRSAFPVLAHQAYLNAGTCGPVPEAARAAAVDAWTTVTEKGRGPRFHPWRAELADGLRDRYARLLGAVSSDVALTTGTSEGVGRVISGLDLRAGDEILTADDEHPGLQGPLAAASRQLGVRVRAVPLERIADEVVPETKLVACSHVSWASGIRAPSALAQVGRDVPVLLDGAQGIGAVPVDPVALGCSFYAGSGQKWLCGPLGTGSLWVAPEWQERVAVRAPSYATLADPALGLEAVPAAGARRFDAPVLDAPALAAAIAAFDVLDGFGWPAVHGRAAAQATRLADALRSRDIDVVDRDDTTLVAWRVGRDADAVALAQDLAGAGVLVRSLPGTGRVRASVGAWTDDSDLERLLTAL